jgi:hypothetical protein
VSFLKLLEKLTNGTRVEIGYTGTALVFRPGVLTGGACEHDCGTARAIGMGQCGVHCTAHTHTHTHIYIYTTHTLHIHACIVALLALAHAKGPRGHVT